MWEWGVGTPSCAGEGGRSARYDTVPTGGMHGKQPWFLRLHRSHLLPASRTPSAIASSSLDAAAIIPSMACLPTGD